MCTDLVLAGRTPTGRNRLACPSRAVRDRPPVVGETNLKFG